MFLILIKTYFGPTGHFKGLNVKNLGASSFLYSTSNGKKSLKEIVIPSQTLSAKYNFKEIEKTWYDWWESHNFFKPTKKDSESFVLLLPPPNITGVLHLGHVLTTTLQDVIIRWRRMNGQSVLWIPGVDHAGIATQVVVEKNLKQALGLTKHNLGKEDFVKKIWDWKDVHEKKIYDQLRTIGASLDWSRAGFTMDPAHSRVVSKSFIELYNKGLIERKKSLINWSCALKSSISDIEINWHNITKATKFNIPGYDVPIEFGLMYKIAYKVCERDDEIIVHTTRPETMFGDVAVAVHPNDPKYAKYKNDLVWHPFRCEKIPIIPDYFVDPNKGSGAVKITPSHSHEDFEVSQRHNLKSLDVIDEEGLIKNVGQNESFFGLKRYEARKVVINELIKLNLFRGAYEHEMKIPFCSRSGDIVEYLSKSQWFLRCESLAEDAINLVKNGDLKLVPKNYESVWFNWLSKCKDWNLSRQLWWGHQIPMYLCKMNEKEVWIGALNLEEAEHKASEIFKTNKENIQITQDPDVLDTWFSSGLLPLSLLSSSTSNHIPISLMVTGHDILFFWIIRMVFLYRCLKGNLPFNEVLLHGLICDSKGRKMSKSLGNVIRPEDVVNGKKLNDMREDLKNSFKEGSITLEEYQIALKTQKQMFPQGIPDCGMDALRFSLCSSNFLSASVNFDIQICHSNRDFCNKIWQAFKYFMKIMEDCKAVGYADPLVDFEYGKLDYEKLNVLDKWILSRTAYVVKIVNQSMSSNRFSAATKSIRMLVIEDFCGVYLECSKIILKNDSSQYEKVILIFLQCMDTYLKLLSPFMPFVTEHLYYFLPQLKNFDKVNTIMFAKFPCWEIWKHHQNDGLEQNFKDVFKVLSSVRQAVVTYNLTSKKPTVYLKCDQYLENIIFGEVSEALAKLGKVGQFLLNEKHEEVNVIERIIDDHITAYIEHEYDKETLLKMLSPIIEKEEGIKARIEKLNGREGKGSLEKKITLSEKIQFEKKINSLEETLTKIEEFKKVIDNCKI